MLHLHPHHLVLFQHVTRNDSTSVCQSKGRSGQSPNVRFSTLKLLWHLWKAVWWFSLQYVNKWCAFSSDCWLFSSASGLWFQLKEFYEVCNRGNPQIRIEMFCSVPVLICKPTYSARVWCEITQLLIIGTVLMNRIRLLNVYRKQI